MYSVPENATFLNVKRLAMLMTFFLCLGIFDAFAVKSFPPLIPEGETFEDIDQLIKNIIPRSPVIAVDISPDGNMLVVGSDDGTARLWDMSKHSEIGRFEGHGSSVRSVAFSADGKMVATGSDDGAARLIDIATLSGLGQFKGHDDWIQSVAFSPDGKTLATGSSDGTARLWDVSMYSEIDEFKGHGSKVLSVAFSPDGKMVASGAYDGSACVWNASTFSEICRFEGHGSRVRSVSFSPDGRAVATGSYDGTTRLWDLSTYLEIGRFKDDGKLVLSIAFSREGKMLVTGLSDGTARLWDVSTFSEIGRFEGHGDWVRSVAFSPKGRLFATGSDDGTARIWDVSTFSEIDRFEGHRDWVQTVAFSPDGKKLATGSDDGTARVWDMPTLSEIGRFESHGSRVLSVAFSPDGKTVVTGLDDGTARVLDVSTFSEIGRFESHGSRVLSVAFSPDGKTVVTGLDNGTARVWNASTFSEIGRFEGHGSRVLSIAFSPDGKTVATGSDDRTARVWDVFTFLEIGRCENHSSRIRTVAFSPDGKKLATGSDDRTARVWDAAAFSEIGRFEGLGSRVLSVSFSPDDKALAMGLDDGKALVGDVSTFTEINRFRGYGSHIISVAFSPDCEMLATGSGDGIVKLWQPTVERPLRIFTAGRNGNWISCDARCCLCKRFDDGSFLMKKEEGRIQPVAPGDEAQKGKEGGLEISIPETLVVHDGMLTEFIISVKNNDERRTYWLKATQIHGAGGRVVFHPPASATVLDPGESLDMKAGASAMTGHVNPKEGEEILTIRITTAHHKPLLLYTSVKIISPMLKVVGVEQQSRGDRVIVATVKNIGTQDLDAETRFDGMIQNTPLRAAFISGLKAEEKVDIPFALPGTIVLDKESRLTINALKLKHSTPMHRWTFTDIPIQALGLPFALLVLIACGTVGLGIAAYYLSIYLHPLVTRLSEKSGELLELPVEQLAPAARLLKRTHRLETVLYECDVKASRMEKAAKFFDRLDVDERAMLLIGRMGETTFSSDQKGIRIFTIRLAPGFMLSLDVCAVVMPPPGMDSWEVLDVLDRYEKIRRTACLVVSVDGEQREELKRATDDAFNWVITPGSRDLTRWLLSPFPLKVLARLISRGVKLSLVSPYQTSGGVERGNVFFGRDQLLAHILQRDPANYLLIGGRQLGKSTLLKEIERRCVGRADLACRYLVLTDDRIVSRLAISLDLPQDSSMETVLSHIRRMSARRRVLFLIDEADRFIEEEEKNDYRTLQLFRGLSEEGVCHFILAGFWELYRVSAFQYHAPIKNFGEILLLDALEPEACRALITIPMSHLSIHYASGDLVERILHQTGRRPNLIAIICVELLKNIDLDNRVVTGEDLENAIFSEAVQISLAGWGALSEKDEAANRLDRIIVYAMIREKEFGLRDVLQIIEKRDLPYGPEAVDWALRRLELAFVLAQERMKYSFRVPIFRKMILNQGPEELLRGEVRGA